MQQTTIKNIVTKGEIAVNEQFLFCPNVLNSIIKLSFAEIFQIFAYIFSKPSAYLMYVGKGVGVKYKRLDYRA